ncbi:hypothetical protein C8R46DRAFT_1208214 [Mycena filopes]|nr:hypothetical protein C8R46DRAFT_1208214 [Mycena filopes]
MFSAKAILTAFALAAATAAAPAVDIKPAPVCQIHDLRYLSRSTDTTTVQLASPTVTVCSGITGPSGCVDLPVVSDACINLTGGLSFLNKEISLVTVLPGFVCTFFEDFGCLNGGVNAHDVAVLTGGTWNMFNVHGIAGTQNFNDLTSSISCSPV